MSFTIASIAPVVLIEFDHQRPGNLRTTGRNQTTRQHIGDPHAQRQRLRQRLAAPALFGAPWPLIFLQLIELVSHQCRGHFRASSDGILNL